MAQTVGSTIAQEQLHAQLRDKKLLPAESSAALKDWLDEQMKLQGWSMRETSLKAGLSEGRVSQIMRGDPPGMEACIRLALVFHTPPEHVLFLAGYLEYDPVVRNVDPELEAINRQIMAISDNSARKLLYNAIKNILKFALGKNEDEGR